MYPLENSLINKLNLSFKLPSKVAKKETLLVVINKVSTSLSNTADSKYRERLASYLLYPDPEIHRIANASSLAVGSSSCGLGKIEDLWIGICGDGIKEEGGT